MRRHVFGCVFFAARKKGEEHEKVVHSRDQGSSHKRLL